MKKITISYDDINRGKYLSGGSKSVLFEMPNGQILKCFNPDYIDMTKQFGFHIEEQLLSATEVPDTGVLVPTSICYLEGHFLGYTLPKAKGQSLYDYSMSLSLDDRADLYQYADIFSKVERTVKNADDIVFPDLCSLKNIFVDSDHNIQFIDYDGLQVGHFPPTSVSNSLGSVDFLQANPKYFQNGLYTKELDKKSLIHLYFSLVFNVGLQNIGRSVSPNHRMTLDDVFSALAIDDVELYEKVSRVFDYHAPNEYLGDTVFRIADEYDLKVDPVPIQAGCYEKRLVKKK